MSAFRVGQRVRILWSEGWPELKGHEGVVEGVGEVGVGLRRGARCWLVAPKAWGSNLAPRRGTNGALRFGALDDQLEPILPEGAAPSTWAECVWQPEHLRATA